MARAMTDIVADRGDEGVERIKQLTDGVGADSVLECVGAPGDQDAAATAIAEPGIYRDLT